MTMPKRIYLDHGASSRTRPAVVQAMMPYLTEHCGNASSLHSFGREARTAVEEARAVLASILRARPEEVFFTSGGTESNNLALKGVAVANAHKGQHIIVSAIEHDCVLNSCRWLGEQGFRVSFLPVDGDGLVEVDQVADTIRNDTVLVSIMHANNEIGTIEPIDRIGGVCRERGVPFHSDACQSFTQVPIDVRTLPVDLMTINAHKIGGPKGVGALYIRDSVQISPWQHGGGHERGMRSGTENVAGIVGFAAAATLARREGDAAIRRLTHLRDRIINAVLTDVPGAYVNGHRTRRLPNNVNLAFTGLEGEAIRLLLELDEMGFAVSTGSACSSNEAENTPSHVLRAIGRNPVEARGALRITLGRDTASEEIDSLLQALPKALGNLRSISSVPIGD
jgi:cysteine desulfurase